MKAYRKFENRLRERYDRLYGGKDCREKIERNRRNLLIKCVVIISFLCIAGAFDLASTAKNSGSLKFGDNGQIVEVRRPDPENGSISFSTEVEIAGTERRETKEYYITIEPVGKKEPQKESALPEKTAAEKAEDELKKLVAQFNVDTAAETVRLPDRLETGEVLTWKKADDSSLPLYLIMAMAAGMLVYKMRFSEIEKEEKRAVESIVRELPEFINKLVLLLNAGVVLNTAFLKAVEDRIQTDHTPNYFYTQLEQICRGVKEANGSLHQELRQFAKRSGVKELMRISNIISDNISKGTDLAEKLKKENDLLWFARKQQSEEKGRLAETKLTLPLVILLSVLILITIAPALMGM
ncbi:type II secretion system F family protein [Anaerovorax odorimutans]|uniref:Type II secretion system F family protein n=1 Tax=Anaerovorax odorimutans TaxID=109327 RepID=A0ABT1RM52_9FIRM|nr:type II secretion system F family protein [Anaerovorax odorimutans]